ncbi:hypothetical protein AZI87_05050 [Bdellovibrio bacteriovorus]|uniref:DUF2917 domain-containing protein n=2 Tax=Pseudobdellovibrionaceae TaxID=213483 RepID=A0A161PTF7_BDEBC|nr:hypothetical protein AZI87_05050 [Bdellovibrio bacteriovorus]
MIFSIMAYMVYQIKIQKGELWNPAKAFVPDAYKVLAGKAWVTMEGSIEDYIIGEGELLPLPRAGTLIEALTDELVVEGVSLKKNSR